MIAATLQLTTLPTSFFVWFVATLISVSGAALVELYARSRIADLQAELAACRASVSPVYRDELPTVEGAFWLRDSRGFESLCHVRVIQGDLWVGGASRVTAFADSGYQWAGPLPWPREETV
jgi:hypothetical protein